MGQTVWAKEWSAKYITQLYTGPDLETIKEFAEDGLWHSYEPVGGNTSSDPRNTNPENFHARVGTNNSGTSTIGSDMILPSNLTNLGDSDRRWVAQFSLTGLKVSTTAQPCTVSASGQGATS